MKRIMVLFTALILFASIETFASNNLYDEIIQKSKVHSIKKLIVKPVRIQGSYTTSLGCTISYDLTLDVTAVWGWPPVKVKSVNGTLTFSGTCHGTQNVSATLRGTATCYSNGITDLDWSYISDEDKLADINDPDFLLNIGSAIANAE